ncbi:aspartate carbamoyltransferase [Candidatus Roizmanbacteria bacterium]|nr:aspartate carbamoyltransferase [Candidatus Roizmanbacteria bacterium]
MAIRLEVTPKITTNFKSRHILSLDQFTPVSLRKLFETTDRIIKLLKRKSPLEILKRSVITLLFFEPSTRTFGSFSSAIKRLGGQTIDLLDPEKTTSFVKGESLKDTMQVLGTYSDIIIIRHPEKGFVQKAAAVSPVPVISGGEGAGEHPTQALYDTFTLYQKFGKLSHLKGLVLGDALYSRSIHSFIKALSLFPKDVIYLFSPPGLEISYDFERKLHGKIKLVRITRENEIPEDCNFWYTNRIQKERFKSRSVYEKALKDFPVITPELLAKKGNRDMIILDPLPRVGNIDIRVDSDPRSLYLTKQLENGVYIRMALVSLILGKI